MTQEQFDEWIAALKDPETKKGKEALKDKHGKMCCLGVLACLHKVPHTERGGVFAFTFEGSRSTSTTFPPNGWMGLSGDDMRSLANINDANDTFKPVIQFLESNKLDIVRK
tara:strand:- start:4957 stop:5289 length:333 start_codon:yes stop_codon:yes gene_type:complete